MFSKHRFVHLDRLIVFVSWTAVLSWLIHSDRYLLFLRPGFSYLLILACILMIGFIIGTLRSERHHHATSFTVRYMRVAVLTLPLVYLVVARDITLGSYAFKKRSTDVSAVGKIRARRTLEDIKKSNTLTTLEILQYFKEFEGKRITTEGMVYKGEDVPDQYFLVFRFLMICCAADSMPAGALVEHEDVGKYKNDTWVRVEGVLGLKNLENFTLPYIKADTISVIEAPKFPYLIPSFS